jgi:hypothetical protein
MIIVTQILNQVYLLLKIQTLPPTTAFHTPTFSMVTYYDELEIEDFAWDPVARLFHYPCPCGDRFEISKGQLRDGEEIATCPSCSLIVRVIYDYVSEIQCSR